MQALNNGRPVQPGRAPRVTCPSLTIQTTVQAAPQGADPS